MSRHALFQNFDYQDAIDDYDAVGAGSEDEELSPEDQALMSQGTTDVRAALANEADKVTTEQIQEALWHYYYDVDKSVAYLLSTYIAPAPKPAKQSNPNKSEGEADPRSERLAPKRRLSLSNTQFFHDMPWLNIPKHRETIFIEPPCRRMGGLLGGSGTQPKMSKLQALAAARKKKNEDKKVDDRVKETQEDMLSLAIADKSRTRAVDKTALGGGSKRRKLGPSSSTGLENSATDATIDTEKDAARRNTDLEPTPTSGQTVMRASETTPKGNPVSKAQPSAFARTLLGSASKSPKHSQAPSFPFPYPSLAVPVVGAFSGPSPDDVVMAAQAKAVKMGTKQPKTKSKDERKDVADGLSDIKLDDTPLPKSKNLNVLEEYERNKGKKSASFVVVGHVDAGKSTLMGRLLMDLGSVGERTVAKYRKEAKNIGKASFALAWVLDQQDEERDRGVTIDFATKHFETDSTSFTILDAPGHRDFIPNMIAGASQADFALLVVDASTGAFEAGLRGQTREHALLIRSLGVARVIVVVNKLDNVKWAEDRFDEICQQVTGFLSVLGFREKSMTFVPLSGLQGDNVVHRSSEDAAAWYTGPTLIEELERSEPMARQLDKPLRMNISTVYWTHKSPVTITGRIDAGSLQMGDALAIQPSGEKAYVKSMELNGEAVDWAVAGQLVVVHLSHIDAIHVRAGDIACDPKAPVSAVDTFVMKALAFDVLMPSLVDVHRGRLHAAGQIQELQALLDKASGAVIKKRPKIVKSTELARIKVKLNSKLPLEAGQRVVLRIDGETVAAGLLE